MMAGRFAARPVKLAIASGFAFLLAALASQLAARQQSGIAALWPADAVLLALLLTQVKRRRDQAALIAGAWVGSLLSSILRGQPPIQVLLFPIANMIESVVAAWLIRRLGGSGSFDRVRDAVALMIACVVAPLASAVPGAIALGGMGPIPFGQAYFSWYVANGLSLALVTPIVIACIELGDRERSAPVAASRISEVILILGLVAAVSTLVFCFAQRPLLFAILPFVLLATFRLRQFGAAAAVAIVAAISEHATGAGIGPVAQVVRDGGEQLLFLQFFLAVTFVIALPIAATLTERDQRAQEAHLIADHFKAVVENAGEVIFRTDLVGNWTYLNPAWETLSGYPIEGSLGEPLYACVDPAEQEELAQWASPVFAGEVGATRRMLRFHTASGSVRWMELCIQGLRDSDSVIIGATGTLRDIDDRKRLEEHVMTAKRRAEERAREATLLASTDELTGLANRRAFLRHLDRQLEASTEFGWSLTIAMFDVDHFKSVNDRFGHMVGDRVLELVAARAVAVVRSGDLVGRLGGEEFGILMPGATAEDAAIVAERLRQTIESPAESDDGSWLPSVTVSIGVASLETQHNGAELLAAADAALYAAKGAGRNRIKIAA